MSEKLNVEGREISIKAINNFDYLSLNDIAGRNEAGSEIIKNWFRTITTQDFLREWESIYNPNFNLVESHRIRSEAGKVTFTMGIGKWIEQTEAIGLISKSGRYGGTFAHRDIAFEFGTRISARFKILLIQEFQRLKLDEAQRKRIEWNAGRELARINYPIMTAAIEETSESLRKTEKSFAFSSEADMINVIVFGMTAKHFREQNPDAKGNLRDNASKEENIVLANLESMNAELIRKGASVESRERALTDMAANQFEILGRKFLKD